MILAILAIVAILAILALRYLLYLRCDRDTFFYFHRRPAECREGLSPAVKALNWVNRLPMWEPTIFWFFDYFLSPFSLSATQPPNSDALERDEYLLINTQFRLV